MSLNLGHIWQGLHLMCGLVIVISTACYASIPEASPPTYLCAQTYAHCLTSSCKPIKSHFVLCQCEVLQGMSISLTPCDKRKIWTDANHIKHLLSAYSFAKITHNKTMSCAEGNPWADCIDKPCTINPSDPSHALCTCELHTDVAFITLGGNCHTQTCKTGYWSGLNIKMDKLLRKTLAQTPGEITGPVDYTYCDPVD